MTLEEWIPAKQAAARIGISYELLMHKIRQGEIKSEKRGWSRFVHRDEVTRAKKKEAKKRRAKRNKRTKKGK
jgi:hypothetical protein